MFHAIRHAGGFVVGRTTETGGAHIIARDASRNIVHVGTDDATETGVRTELHVRGVQALGWTRGEVGTQVQAMFEGGKMSEDDFPYTAEEAGELPR